MLKDSVQFPVFVIVDALDECPNTHATPSARKKVLDLMTGLIKSEHPNLHLCITSRPEQDIQTNLDPLTSTSLRVSLHEECGQREDINNYIRYFVQTNDAMRKWRTEDKEVVIDTLSERADGMSVIFGAVSHEYYSQFWTGFDGCIANWTR